MCGHRAENLLWAPDPRDDLAFTLYTMDCEHKDAYEKTEELLSHTPSFIFSGIDDVINYVQRNLPNEASQLDDSDFLNLFNSLD